MSLKLTDITVTVVDGRSTLTIVDGIDLDVSAGETVALTGPSGSGKSTLLSVAGLLLRPTSGRVEIAGVDVTDQSDRERTRLRGSTIGVVYQASNLLPSLTARQQVEVVAHVNGSLDRAARSRVVDLLTRVGLEDRLDSFPGELSGGERQRVALARALMMEPKVLLADEPTSALDPARAAEVKQLLLDEAARLGTATLLVTHDGAAATGADREVRLERAPSIVG